ncbi:MAG: hypothetical protein ABI140_14060 [Jatrophihabitantaceae bacterium]
MFWSILGFGSFAYLCIAMGATACRGIRSHGDLLHHVNLGLSPSDGISLVGSFLGVVVALNIALAAQQRPRDPKERLQDADWTSYVTVIALLSALSAVIVCWGCWLSLARQGAWGTCIGVSLMAITSAALAAALRVRPRPDEAWLADRHILHERQRQLRNEITTLRHRRPYSNMAWWVIAIRCTISGLVIGLVSAGISDLAFSVLTSPLRLADLALMASMASSLDVALLYFVSRAWWLVPAIRDRLTTISEIWFLVMSASLAFSLATALLAAVPGDWKIAVGVYDLCYLGLPPLIVALDSKLGLLTHPLRAATGRSLECEYREVTADLIEVRQRLSAS